MSVKIMLVEDHAIMREGLCALIDREPDMEIIGQAENGLKAVQQARELKPDVVIMDVTLPEMNGIEATRLIKANMSEVRVLALSAYDTPKYVMDMIHAGVAGYLLKDCISSELIDAIRKVMNDESYLSPKITSIVLNEHKLDPYSTSAYPSDDILKDNEFQLVKLLAEGKTPRQIAQELGIKIKTVEARRRRIMKKLQIDSFADLVKYAIRKGLASC